MALMACPLCGKRKPKRSCPARGDKICPVCCGTHREVSIACPFECRYLDEARDRDRAAAEPPEFVFKEVRVDEEFLKDHEELVDAVGSAAFAGAIETPGAADRDALEALDALVRTQKTLESGIYYETRPHSAFARLIVERVQEAIEEFRESERERSGMTRTRDADVLKALVFLLRLGRDRDNGRPKGRAFLHLMSRHFGGGVEPGPRASPIILPGA